MLNLKKSIHFLNLLSKNSKFNKNLGENSKSKILNNESLSINLDEISRILMKKGVFC